MRKITATILSLFAIATPITGAATGCYALKATPSVTAGAETAVDCRTAIADGVKAISAGNILHVFNRAHGGFWQSYTHESPVVEMDFDETGVLYFLDGKNQLYTLDSKYLDKDAKAESANLQCSTFTLEKDTLYYANVTAQQNALQTTVYQAPVQDLANVSESFTAKTFFTALCYWETDLYALDGTDHLYRLSLTTDKAKEIAKLPEGTTDVVIASGTVFGATASGSFYGYNLQTPEVEGTHTQFTQIVYEEGDFSALSATNTEVHLLNGKTPYVYSTESGTLAEGKGDYRRPQTDAIPTLDVKQTIIEGAGDFSIVQTAPNALFVEVDFDSAKENDRFTTLSATRKEKEMTALKLLEKDGYAVLVARKTPESPYSTYILPVEQTTEITSGILSYSEKKTGYLSSAVSVYKYPHLGFGGSQEKLPRGGEVTLLGEVKGLDCAYYKIACGDGVGYIPQAYVQPTEGLPSVTEQVLLGTKKGNTDAVWRLAYLVLGTGAICILIDFLFLHKKRDD